MTRADLPAPSHYGWSWNDVHLATEDLVFSKAVDKLKLKLNLEEEVAIAWVTHLRRKLYAGARPR